MPNILLIGASSAIAAEMARVYRARGDRLFLMARNPEKLEALRAELGDAVVGVIAADLDEVEGNAARIREAVERMGSVDVAVIAHGLLGDQIATEESWREARAVLATNFLSPVSLLIPIANFLESQGKGTIAVLGSVAGERGRPRNYTYGAAKGAIMTYLQGVRSRLYGAGIKVVLIRLGPVHTPMTVDHEKNALFATAERAARDIVKAIDRAAPEPYVPWYWAPIMLAVRWMPEPIFQRVKFLSGR